MGKIKILTSVLILTLTGCMTNYATQDSHSVASAVKTVDSEFDANPIYVGPDIHNNNLLSSETIRLVRTTGAEGEIPTTILSVNFMYTGSDWAFYESVSFQGGEYKKIDDSNRKVLGCSAGCTHLEETVLILPEGFLEANQDSGFKIRYNSRSLKSKVVNVPAEYIKGFLVAVPL